MAVTDSAVKELPLLVSYMLETSVIADEEDDGKLRRAVHRAVVIRNRLTARAMESFNVLCGSRSNPDLVCLLELLFSIKQQQYHAAATRGLQALRFWPHQLSSFINPLRLAVYDVTCRALLSANNSNVKGDQVVVQAGELPMQALAFVRAGARGVVLLHPPPTMNVTINDDGGEVFHVIDHDDLEEKDGLDVKRLVAEMDMLLEPLRRSYEELPGDPDAPRIESLAWQVQEQEPGPDEYSFVLTLKLEERKDDNKLSVTEAVNRRIRSSIFRKDHLLTRPMVLKAVKEKYPGLDIVCDKPQLFPYDSSSTAAAVALERLAKVALGQGIWIVPGVVEFDYVCRMTSRFNTTYYYIGNYVCWPVPRSAAKYYHPSGNELRQSASSRFLYDLVELERGILTIGSDVLGVVLASRYFRDMSEEQKLELVAECLGKAPELANISRMFSVGNLLLLGDL